MWLWKIKMHGYLCLRVSRVFRQTFSATISLYPPHTPAPPLPPGGKQDLPNGADAQLKDLIESTSAAHPCPLSAAKAKDAAGAADEAVWSMLWGW
jgi:hypothetical protein